MTTPKQPPATAGALGWSGPFWVIALSPLATLPLGLLIFRMFARVEGSSIGLPEVSHGFLWDSHWGYARIPATFVAALLPGVINLTPFIWLRDEERFTRIAAATAGLLGLVRVLIPLVVLIPAVTSDVREPQARPDSDFSTDFGTIWFGGSVSVDGPHESLDMVKGNDGRTYFWFDEGFLEFGPGLEKAWGLGALTWLIGLLVWLGFGSSASRASPGSRRLGPTRLRWTEEQFVPRDTVGPVRRG